MGRAGRPQWQTRAGGPSGSWRGWDSAPIFGEEAHSRAGLLPLTLCSLRPRHHGDIIGKRLVLCLLLALHALFFLPPSRRPGGVGSRGESGTRPAPPPWGACRPQPPSQRPSASSAPPLSPTNPGGPALPHSPVWHFCPTPSRPGWGPCCHPWSLGPPWRRSLGMVGSKGNWLGVYLRVCVLCTRHGPPETQTRYRQPGSCHPWESGNPWWGLG